MSVYYTEILLICTTRAVTNQAVVDYTFISLSFTPQNVILFSGRAKIDKDGKTEKLNHCN